MQYKSLGKSNVSVSEISFGCMSLSGDEAANSTLLHQALDDGINLFDTADLYGQGLNEQMVGNTFRGMRQRVVLATKVGNQWRKDGSWDWNPTKAYILQAADASLTRLQTDYIDLYQLHGGTMQDPMDETIEAFELLKAQGKIRHYGLSSIRPDVIREYVRRSGIVSVMMQYSLLDRRPEESNLALLQEHRIGVLARGSLAKGLLAGKPAAAYLNYSATDVRRAADAIRTVAETHRSRAAVATRFVLQHPAVTAAVVGIRTEPQLTDALRISQVPHLNESETENLRGAIPPNQYTEHR